MLQILIDFSSKPGVVRGQVRGQWDDSVVRAFATKPEDLMSPGTHVDKQLQLSFDLYLSLGQVFACMCTCNEYTNVILKV